MRLLLVLRINQIKNHLKRGRIRSYLLIVPLGAVFLTGVGYLFSKVFGYLARHPDFPVEFKLFLAEKILIMVCLTLFVMLILSAMIAALNVFFLSRDLPLLIASPIPIQRLFSWKMVETIINSSGMVVVIALPILFVYCGFFAPGLAGTLAVLTVFFVFVICSVLLAVLIGLLIPAVFSIHRAQPFFTLLSILLISGLVIFLRILRPERLLQPGAIDNLYAFMRSMETERFSMFPFYWAARAIASVSRQDPAGFWNSMVLLLFVVLFVVLVMRVYQIKWYVRLIEKHAEGKPAKRRRLWLRRGGGHGGFGLFRKEINVFIRTPTQWSQLIIIGAMVVVFILNLRSIPVPHPSVTLLVAYLNMGLAVFVAIGLNSRFVFTSIPGEGSALIHVIASPYDKGRFFRFKFLFYLVPQLAIGFSLFFVGDLLLGLDPFFRFAGVVFLLPVITFLTVFALYLGLRVNSRDSLSPQHLLLTTHGIFYMVGSLFYTVACLVIFSRPMFLVYYNLYRWRPIPFPSVVFWIALFFAANTLAVLWIYRNSMRRWSSREF